MRPKVRSHILNYALGKCAIFSRLYIDITLLGWQKRPFVPLVKKTYGKCVLWYSKLYPGTHSIESVEITFRKERVCVCVREREREKDETRLRGRGEWARRKRKLRSHESLHSPPSDKASSEDADDWRRVGVPLPWRRPAFRVNSKDIGGRALCMMTCWKLKHLKTSVGNNLSY